MRPARRVVLLVAALCMAADTAEAASTPLLPDLDQAYPRELQVETDTSSGTTRFHLGFLSAVNNYGAGPLIVHGHRDGRLQSEMTADQIVKNADGSETVRPNVGRLVYVDATTHRHWHYVGFDRYELRRARGFGLVVPDRKSGFCLGDRYDTFPGRLLPAEPPAAVYTGNCAPDHPEAPEVTEGVSVGYGDDYPPVKEGQYVDVTGVPAGRYYLVHRTNANRALVETDYSNDASSLLVALAWPHTMQSPPAITVLNTCPDTDRCPIPRMTERRASDFARTVLARYLGGPRTAELACRVRSAKAARCRTAFGRGHRRYSGVIAVAYRIRDGLPSWTYRTDLRVNGRRLPAKSGSVPLY